MKNNAKKYVIGIFDDDEKLLSGIPIVRSEGVNIKEVYSPFPVHGVDEALGYARSKIARSAFIFGLLGTILALTMMYYMMGYDWPANIGGKNAAPLPDFIPITFELTVLLSALGMVGTFMVISNLKPWGTPNLFDKRQTDDKHVVVVNLKKSKLNEEELSTLFNKAGASEVKTKTL